MVSKTSLFTLRAFVLGAVGLCCSHSVAAKPASKLVTIAIPQLSLEYAIQAARAAMAFCRAQGFQVAVTVVDRGGNPQVVLRDTLAMRLTLTISREKAYTAMTFASPTSTLVDTAVGKALRGQPSLLFAGGGVPIVAMGTTIAGIGVSGTSTAQMDERCAREGVSAISSDLEMLDL
jgi:uncharacterized protein GlcG (DUF336 family)